MDINDISINALVRDSGLCRGFEWCNNGAFSCQWLGFDIVVSASTQSIIVRDPDCATQIEFRRVWPKAFGAFIGGLHWDFKEEGEAA